MSDSLREKAYLAAGCFWSVEERFRTTPGVIETAVGYQGGHLENPSYEQVCRIDTGHAEVVEVTYDPSQINYTAILDIFWQSHDPTTLNRQGPDVGTQYRSAIFYTSSEQRFTAENSKKEWDSRGVFANKIVTEISPAKPFWRAEGYHQKYVAKKRNLL